jgi:hypothetical protein
MNKSIKIQAFITCFAVMSTLAQENNVHHKKQLSDGIYTVTVPRGTKLLPEPSENSERIKSRIVIGRDSIYYSLNADNIEKGITVKEGKINKKRKLYKDHTITFEMIPDILSNPLKIQIFFNFPDMMAYVYMDVSKNKKLKYEKFKPVNNSPLDRIPLLICYEDDENDSTEKLLNRYSRNNLITVTSYSILQEKIFKNINKCLFVYYNLTDK